MVEREGGGDGAVDDNDRIEEGGKRLKGGLK